MLVSTQTVDILQDIETFCDNDSVWGFQKWYKPLVKLIMPLGSPLKIHLTGLVGNPFVDQGQSHSLNEGAHVVTVESKVISIHRRHYCVSF